MTDDLGHLLARADATLRDHLCPGATANDHGLKHCAECCYGSELLAATEEELNDLLLIRDLRDAVRRLSGVPGGGEPQPTTSTDSYWLEPPPGVSAEVWDTFLNAKVRIWFCPEDSDHRVEWDDEGATCLDCGRKSTPVRSAGGGDQPDTPCPHCKGLRRVYENDPDAPPGLVPCPACTDKETPA